MRKGTYTWNKKRQKGRVRGRCHSGEMIRDDMLLVLKIEGRGPTIWKRPGNGFFPGDSTKIPSPAENLILA